MKIKLILLLLIIIYLIGYFNNVSPENYIKKEIDIDISSCKIENINDTHDGFHGDGEQIIKINCNENSNDILEQLDDWNEFPLTENLQLIMYGGVRDKMSYEYNLAQKNGIPQITNGYYYFIDRQSNSNDDKEIFNRHALNFTLAIFDVDTNIMYYYEIDT